jgi:predicted nucleic-acid-binding protein
MVLLIDTNIILDFFMDRNYYLEETKQIFNKIHSREITGVLAAHTINNLWFILRKQFSSQQRREIISSLLNLFEISSLNKDKLLSAIQRDDFSDFEDCLQDECAAAVHADFIITRDKNDFKNSKIKALLPGEALKILF